jgi:hypothetical protein
MVAGRVAYFPAGSNLMLTVHRIYWAMARLLGGVFSGMDFEPYVVDALGQPGHEVYDWVSMDN